MKAQYHGEIYDIIAVNFPEQLFGLGDADDPDDDGLWVRAENTEAVFYQQNTELTHPETKP
jgi:hypothetical protein